MLPRKYVSDEELREYLVVRFTQLYKTSFGNSKTQPRRVLEGLIKGVAEGVDDGTREFTTSDAGVIVAEFPQLSRVLAAMARDWDVQNRSAV